MIYQDLFVGGVAVSLGAILIAIAAVNWEWYFQLRKAQWLEGRLGRNGVRCLYGLVGLVLIGLGFAIAAGFGPNASSRSSSLQPGMDGVLGARQVE